MPRYFTLDEAQRAVAHLAPEIRKALSLRADMRRAEEELQDVARKVMLTGGLAVDTQRVSAVKTTREEVVGRLQAIIDSIHETGCLVKDLNTGLLDFPTLYRGNEVYLCWRADEDKISYWHGVEEGFPGRKPIDEEFLQNHRGGAS